MGRRGEIRRGKNYRFYGKGPILLDARGKTNMRANTPNTKRFWCLIIEKKVGCKNYVSLAFRWGGINNLG